MGLGLMDYVLETQNNKHIVKFLMLPADNQNCYMLLKNAIYNDCKNETLIDFHLKTIDTNDGSDCHNLNNLFYMFEEIKYYTHEQLLPNNYIRSIVNACLIERPCTFNVYHEQTLPRKHFLIGIMMIYWQCEVVDSSTEFVTLYFKLLKLILNKDAGEFCKSFGEELVKIEQSFSTVYQLGSNYNNQHQSEENIFHYYEKYIANFQFVLLYAAIVTEQPIILDAIFKFEHFLTLSPTFPSNMQPTKIHHYCMSKFLQNKYELGRNELPNNWITSAVFNQFLDSKIIKANNVCKIDANCLLPYYNYHSIEYSNEDDLIMNEDYDTIDYILNNPDLKSSIVHPVLETIIRLKIEKYRHILRLNFTFLLVSLFSSIGLLYLYHFDYYEQNTVVYDICKLDKYLGWPLQQTTTTLTRFWIICAILTTRIIAGSIREYVKYLMRRKEGHLEALDAGIIICPLLLMIFTIVYWIYPINMVITLIAIFEAVNFIIIVVATNIYLGWWQSNESKLTQLAKRYVTLADQIRKFYIFAEDTFIDTLILSAIRHFCRYSPYHRLQIIYIDLNTGCVLMN